MGSSDSPSEDSGADPSPGNSDNPSERSDTDDSSGEAPDQVVEPEPDFVVSTSGELDSALEEVQKGEVIVLNDGDYGSLSITNKSYTANVTLRAKNSGQAHFSRIVLKSVSHLTLEGLQVSMSQAENYGITVDNSSSVILLNNKVHAADFNIGKNIFLRDVENILIQGNDISATNDGIHTVGFLRNFKAVGNHIILRPEVMPEGAHADCFQFRSGPLVGVKILRNKIAYSHQNIFLQNVGMGPWKDIEISGNISLLKSNETDLAGKHIHLGSVENLKVEGNTLATPLAGQYGHGLSTPGGVSGSFTVRNNIFYNAVYNNYGKVSDYNLFYTDVKPLSPDHGYHLTDIQDFTGQDLNSIEANPEFVDLSAEDVKLMSTSPAIDNGVDLGPNLLDFFGTPRPQGGAWDIGAVED